MDRRRRLPNRRPCDTLVIRHNGTSYNVTVGSYLDGAVGEVFIDGPKIGSEVAHLIHDIAVVISIAIQFRVPVVVMADAVARIEATGEPSTIVGAVLDLLAGRVRDD